MHQTHARVGMHRTSYSVQFSLCTWCEPYVFTEPSFFQLFQAQNKQNLAPKNDEILKYLEKDRADHVKTSESLTSDINGILQVQKTQSILIETLFHQLSEKIDSDRFCRENNSRTLMEWMDKLTQSLMSLQSVMEGQSRRLEWIEYNIFHIMNQGAHTAAGRKQDATSPRRPMGSIFQDFKFSIPEISETNTKNKVSPTSSVQVAGNQSVRDPAATLGPTHNNPTMQTKMELDGGLSTDLTQKLNLGPPKADRLTSPADQTNKISPASDVVRAPFILQDWMSTVTSTASTIMTNDKTDSSANSGNSADSSKTGGNSELAPIMNHTADINTMISLNPHSTEPKTTKIISGTPSAADIRKPSHGQSNDTPI